MRGGEGGVWEGEGGLRLKSINFSFALCSATPGSKAANQASLPTEELRHSSCLTKSNMAFPSDYGTLLRFPARRYEQSR